jgi:beta-mannosidase
VTETAIATLDLGGDWQVRQIGGDLAVPAKVPGNIHTDLLASKNIPDPFYRDNEIAVQWVGQSAWVYERTFEVTEDLLARDRVLLCCDGLDTFASVRLNGKLVGKADNMYRRWEFDAKSLLHPGENRIEVRFDSVLPHMRRQEKLRNLSSPVHQPWEPHGRSYVRKEQCNFGLDWGPVLVTCGIWRGIRLSGFDTARVVDVHVRQDHSTRGSVGLTVAVEAERVGRQKLSVAVRVKYAGQEVAQACETLRGSKATVALRIDDPHLWWPNGMGEQALYELEVDLLDEAGERIDRDARRVGLRTLGLRRRKDRWGESFEFVANGKPFFAKGANWIPADSFSTRVTPDQLGFLLGSAASVHMNMIRVWGGGYYESDKFYDLCDELGLCVWQDFMYACASFPTFDEAFMANVRAETEDNVRRLRHHACLALWCGNNELEMFVANDGGWPRMPWDAYKLLFDKLIPSVVRRLDPDRDYWPSSPHSPRGDRKNHGNPDVGDAHLWAVWHGRQPFEWYRSTNHRFCSEFGFQSFPEPKTVHAYTNEEERNITSRVMEHHQRSFTGNSNIMHYMLSWFRMPVGFDNTLWLSQIQQGLAIKYAVEHWRRNMPRCMGALYWQLNDCWPVASWASIDYHGRWKALHYLAGRFFAPLLVSALENLEKRTVELHVTSDLAEARNLTLRWEITDPAGERLDEGSKEIVARPVRNTKAHVLRMGNLLKDRSGQDLLIWVELVADGEVVSSDLATFVRPKHLTLEDPEIAWSVETSTDGSFLVDLTAEKPALWAWLELEGEDAEFEDNFVSLRPGRTVHLEVTPSRELTLAKFRDKLRVRSLIDTYR